MIAWVKMVRKDANIDVEVFDGNVTFHIIGGNNSFSLSENDWKELVQKINREIDAK